MPDLQTVLQQPAALRTELQAPAPIRTTLQAGQGPAGATGPQGEPGGNVALTAATTLHGHRLIATDAAGLAVHADAATLAHALATVGLTEHAASLGEPLQAISAGPIVHAGWDWIAGPVLLGLDGEPTQVLPPGALYALPIGWGQGQTLTLAIKSPIYL